METQKKVATVKHLPEAAVQTSPIEMAQGFLQNGGDLANLEKMMALQEQYDKMQAKKAYTKAISEFKSEPLAIKKDKVNSQFKSKYVSIGNLVNSALPGMGKYGLSHKWDIDQADPKSIKVTCIVTHSDGHSEAVSMSAPPDTSGGNSKNPIQQIKSTITYLRAATFEGIMGLASTDANMDDDGNSAGAKAITDKQVSEITDMINATESDEAALLAWAKVESIEAIPAKFYNKIMTQLKAKGVK